MKSFYVAILALCFLSVSALVIAQESQPTHRLHLKSGEEILGELMPKEKIIDKKVYVVFKTQSGGLLQLDKSRMVAKVDDLQDAASDVYQTVHASADDWAKHWDAVNWCKTQKNGKTKYRNEINYHLRQILKLDPHDEDAWRGIKSPVTGKSIYRKRDGAWVNEVERFKSSGYIKVKNKWVSEEALRVGEQLDQADQKGSVNEVMGKWKKLLRNKPGMAADALPQVISPSTVLPLFEFAKQQNTKEMVPLRSLIMEAIATIDSRIALNALVYFAVEDPDLDIRSRAGTLLQNTPYYNPDHVVQTVVSSKYLIARNNNTIQRAALLLNRVDSEAAILALIPALETQHERPTGQRRGSMSTAARNGQIEGLQAGGGDPTEKYMKRNRQVYNALRSLSDNTQDFGYDKAAWQDWYVRKYTHMDMDVRAGDE